MADKVTRIGNDGGMGDRPSDSAGLVLEWLRKNAEDGRITATLSRIGGETGLKYSTVSRALQRLEGMGRIRLLPRKSPTDPNTVRLIKGAEAVDFPAMHDELHELAAGLGMVEGYITRLQKTIKDLEAENAELEERSDLMKGTIVERKELPGGLVMFIIQK